MMPNWVKRAILVGLCLCGKFAAAQGISSGTYNGSQTSLSSTTASITAFPGVPWNLVSSSFSISVTSSVVAAVAGKSIKVYAIAYISGGIASLNFRDGTAINLEGPFAHVANSGRVENVNPPAYLFKTTIGNDLELVYSGAGTVAGRISYWTE